MKLNQLPKLKGVNKKAKRVGRGYGSGKGGHTTGRGTKGQKARSKVRLGFEGGQNPLYKALPQARGFKALDKKEASVVNVRDLERKFDDGTEITKDLLIAENMVSKSAPAIKLLGNGEITKKVTVKGVRASETAKKKIEKAGGKVL